jgi:hypothetical protein
MFYLGQLLDLNCIIERAAMPIGEIKKKRVKKRLKAHMSSDWHTYNKHSFGRVNIWGLSAKSGEIEELHDKEVIWTEFIIYVLIVCITIRRG